MSDRQHRLSEQLAEIAEKLRGFLSRVSTREVVTRCHALFRMSPREAMQKCGLGSPAKQGLYLLGLTLSTPEPEKPQTLSSSQWEIVFRHLRQASEAYVGLFVPPDAVLAALNDDSRHKHRVVATTFLHYFHMGVLASGEQLLARAKAYFPRFDADLERIAGLSGSAAIGMVEWVTNHLQQKLDANVSTLELMAGLYEESDREGWSMLRVQEEVKRRRADDPAWASAELPDPLLLDLSEMERAFGPVATNAFRNIFVVERGGLAGYTFFAGANPLEAKPLIEASDTAAYCPLANLLHIALVGRLSALLESDAVTRDRFLRHRDTVLEQQTEIAVRDFFGPEGEIYTSVAEFSTGEYEHDVVVIWNRVVFVFEAKASPPVEPFRDVERAFTRIDRGFRSDSGPQKAYEQGLRLVRRILRGEEVTLYDENGHVVKRIDPGTVDTGYPVCVTAVDYGPIAIDLSLLLRKEPDDPYPWAINIFDLSTFLQALRKKGWGPAELVQYVEARTLLHGYVTASDELEAAGMFLRLGRLPAPREGVVLRIDPAFSDIFDAIWLEEHGGPPADLQTYDDMTLLEATGETQQLAKQIQAHARGLDGEPDVPSKVGRNDPCPCGSRKKFKKCHGR